MVENLILIVMITPVQEEEALIAAYRKEIEDTMEIVREVSKRKQVTAIVDYYLSVKLFIILLRR